MTRPSAEERERVEGWQNWFETLSLDQQNAVTEQACVRDEEDKTDTEVCVEWSKWFEALNFDQQDAVLEHIERDSENKTETEDSVTSEPSTSKEKTKPAFEGTITYDEGRMPLCSDERPELDAEYLSRIISDVNTQIEMSCEVTGLFDEQEFRVQVSAYVEDYEAKKAAAEKEFVGNARVNACLYDPLKSLQMMLGIFLNQISNWGARGRHMEVVTIPNINRLLARGVLPGYEHKFCKNIHNILRDNGAINDWYIDTFDTYTRELETPIMEIRGLVEFLFLIINEGNELQEEAVGHLPRPWEKESKASDTSNPDHGQPTNTKSKASSSKDADKFDLASAIASVVEEFGTLGSEPAEEPQLLRTTNTNLTYINLHPNTEPTNQSRGKRADGPTEDNLKKMSKAAYMDTRFNQDFYKRSDEYLRALTGRATFGPTRNDRLKALKTTPEWKKKLMDNHYIESLYVGNRELEVFTVCYDLAKKALATAEECVRMVQESQPLAVNMMVDYDTFVQMADELEARVMEGGFSEQGEILGGEGAAEGWWGGDEEGKGKA